MCRQRDGCAKLELVNEKVEVVIRTSLLSTAAEDGKPASTFHGWGMFHFWARQDGQGVFLRSRQPLQIILREHMTGERESETKRRQAGSMR